MISNMNTIQRGELLQSIANTIGDYRQLGIPPQFRIPALTAEHIDKWVKQFNQFGAHYELVLLQEMKYILGKVYISQEKARNNINRILTSKKLFGSTPKTGLVGTQFLQIQRHGESQNDLMNLVNEILNTEYQLKITDCGVTPHQYLYLDDCLFTGNTVLNDVKNWIPQARRGTVIHLVFFATHQRGWRYIKEKLQPYSEIHGIEIKYWTIRTYNNLIWPPEKNECLWPLELKDDSYVDSYIMQLNERTQVSPYPPRLFRSKQVSQESIFSSPQNRIVVENALLQAGAFITSLPKKPKLEMRPLGYEKFASLGFGAFVITYRNCSNNCPLALWWGDAYKQHPHPFSKWYPLFPRRVNESLYSSELYDSL